MNIKCISTRESSENCDEHAEYIYLGKSYCKRHMELSVKSAKEERKIDDSYCSKLNCEICNYNPKDEKAH